MESRALSDLEALPTRQIWDGVAGRVVRGEHLTMGLLEIAPGSAVPTHQHPHEQAGVLITGSLTFTVGEESQELGPGGTWCIPGNVQHSVVAGPQGAVLVDVFAPAREDWDALPPATESAPASWPA